MLVYCAIAEKEKFRRVFRELLSAQYGAPDSDADLCCSILGYVYHTNTSKPQIHYLYYQNILEASTVPESDADL
jgi:hypothetical protein